MRQQVRRILVNVLIYNGFLMVSLESGRMLDAW
jgi:hypothetical protein